MGLATIRTGGDKFTWLAHNRPRYLFWTRELRSQAARDFHAASAAQQPLNDLHGQPLSGRAAEDHGTALDEFIGPGLQLMEQRLDLEGRRLVLVVPHSSDAVMDMYIESGKLDWDPYWCRPWPSALALGRLLLQEPELVRGKRVCEIGAGLGIAGIAAAFAGASHVVLTDREPLALECARRSARASCIETLGSSDLAELKVSSALLDWTDVSPALGTFDVVLACDLLYERPAVEPLAMLVPTLLDKRGGCFVMADPETRTKAHRQEFLQLLTAARRSPMAVRRASAATVTMDGLSTSVRLVVAESSPLGGTVGVKTLT